MDLLRYRCQPVWNRTLVRASLFFLCACLTRLSTYIRNLLSFLKKSHIWPHIYSTHSFVLQAHTSFLHHFIGRSSPRALCPLPYSFFPLSYPSHFLKKWMSSSHSQTANVDASSQKQRIFGIDLQKGFLSIVFIKIRALTAEFMSSNFNISKLMRCVISAVHQALYKVQMTVFGKFEKRSS